MVLAPQATHATLHKASFPSAVKRMVEIEIMSSSPSSSLSSSSSSSSGDDSSSASDSSSSSSGSGSGRERSTRRIHDCTGVLDTKDRTASHAPSLKPSSERQVPVDTVICIDTDSLDSSPKPQGTVICIDTDSFRGNSKQQPKSQDGVQNLDYDDDFPYLQQDEESFDTAPDKPIAESSSPARRNETKLNSFSRRATDKKPIAQHSTPTRQNETVLNSLSRITAFMDYKLDSPDTNNLEIPHSDTALDYTGRVGTTTREPLTLESQSSDDLELLHQDSSDGLEEAASRFFHSNDKETVEPMKRSSAMPMATSNVAKASSQGQDTSRADHASSIEPRSHRSEQEPIFEPRPERVLEVDPSLYQPPAFRHRPDPIVHHLSIHNRPMNLRKKIPVSELFSNPMDQLWKSKFDTFNQLQSEVANPLVHSDDSIVVSAPTGAGKTALFEMAMARFFASDLQDQSRQRYGNADVTKRRKVVYIAPSKALCEERYEDWTRRLSDINVGIHCAMITGDAEPGDSFREVAASDVILTTPEKWDSLTRKWTENLFLFGSVKLLMLDEVHLLGDGSRGCCLESIICRMKTIQRATRAASESYSERGMSSYTKTSPEALSSFLRIIAVSATLPNVSSIASFLEANEAYAFDSSYRPVPLTTHVVGLGFVGTNQFMFGKSLDRHVPELIKRFSNGRSTIIFCHTKKETETLAMELSKINGIGIANSGGNVQLASRTKLTGLQRSLLRGLAYHHAGLDSSDRKLVEKAFADGKVTCLCATSTLAMGVNLPAHLVIIKGTVTWRGSGEGNQEIDRGTLLQMIGRAGRPGFDTSGTAVIMTDNSSKQKYEELSGGMEVVESHLAAKLMDVMNTEISQRVITSEDTALNWIKSTFFARRAKENPERYGLPMSVSAIDSYLMELCQDSLRRLHQEGMITFGESREIVALPACHVMSQSMVDFEAMKQIVGLPFDADQALLLKALSEFQGLHRPVRRTEKKFLNDVHKMIRYKLDGPPSKVRVQTPAQKAFVLLQAAIGQHYLEDFTLRQEMSYMVEYATRMLSAAEEFSIEGSRHGQVALQSLMLRRSLATSLWGPGDGVLNQLRGVGHKTTAKLRFNKILSFADAVSSSSEAIEHAAGRGPPFGRELRTTVSKILQSTLQLSAYVESYDNTPKYVVCSLARRKPVPGMETVGTDECTGIVKYTLAVYTDRPGSCLFFRSNITLVGEYRMPIPSSCGKVFVHLVASMVGLDERLVLDGNGSVQNSAFTVPSTKVNESGRKKAQKSKGSEQKCTMDRFLTNSNDVRIAGRRSEKRNVEKISASANAGAKKKQRVESSYAESSLGATTAVTPSPLAPPAPPASVPAGDRNNVREQLVDKENRPSKLPTNAGANNLRAPQKSAWNQEKRTQKTLQQSAFRRQKDNPFSLYSYDPNDIESNLQATSFKNAKQENGSSASIIPPHALSSLKLAPAVQRIPRAGFSSARKSTFGANARNGVGRSGRDRGRRRRAFPESRMPDQELLRMKAMEQQAYADAAPGRFRPTQAPRYNDMGFGPRSEEQFGPEGNFLAGPAYQGYGGPGAQERFVQDSIFPNDHPMRNDYHNYGGPRAQECFVQDINLPGDHPMRDDYNGFRGQSVDCYATSGRIEGGGTSQTAFTSCQATGVPNYEQFHGNVSHLYSGADPVFESAFGSQRDQGRHDAAPWSQAAHQGNQQETHWMPGQGYSTQSVSLNSQVTHDPSPPNFVNTQGEGDEEDALFRAAFLYSSGHNR